MESISQMWEGFYKQLQNINLDRFWEHPTIKNTITGVGSIYRDTLINQLGTQLPTRNLLFPPELEYSYYRYYYYYRLINEFVGDLTNKSVLEVGSGYGGLYAVLVREYSMSRYVCIDHIKMQEIHDHFVKNNNTPLQFYKSIENIKDQNFDLFISTLTLAETTEEYVKYICDNILPNCNSVFIINSFLYRGIIKKAMTKLYSDNKQFQYINYKDCKVLIGKGRSV